MTKYLRHIFIFFLLPSFFLQKGSAQRFNFSFEQFTTDDGLSHENVISITKDKDGFIWIGTVNGLNRFDGLSFKTYYHNPDQPQTIPGNYIAGTSLDTKGFLWAATNHGICRIDTRTMKLDRVDLRSQEDKYARYEAMYGGFDSKGTGWYLVNDHLYAINQETLKWKRYPLPATRFHGNSTQIDSKDRVWVSIGRAKYLFDPVTEKFTYLLGFDWSHRDSDIICGWMNEDANGKVWMSTWAHGFYIWNESKKDFDRIPTPLESITNFAFDKDEQGRPFIWCGGGAYGLMAYDTLEKKFFQFKNDPRDKYTHNLGQSGPILRDPASGIVWIGTENGLEKYDRHAIRFQRYRIWQDKNEYSNSQYFFPTGFIQDKTDPTGNTWWVSVWIGGLYKWNRNKQLEEDYVPAAGIKEAGIFSIVQAKDGMIWIGHGLGVQVLDPRTNKFIRHYVDFFPSQKERRTVTFISEDSKSNMWFSTYQGLFSWMRNGDSVVNWWQRIPSLQKIYPLNIREDAEGYIWFSSGKGLGRIDPEKNELVLFTNDKRKGKKLPEDNLGSLYIDKSQNIWVSGVGCLAKLDKHGEVINIYNDQAGFVANGSFGMGEDPAGFLWIATDTRLHRLNPATGHFDYFDKHDGLFNNKIADGFYISNGGELFLGFNGAMNSIQTNNIAFNKKPPRIFVSRLEVKGQQRTFDAANRIRIWPGERNIVIEFAAMNFSQSKKNRFAFWLEGYDSAWTYTSDRVLTFMNLEGGKHNLHVKASNNDGVWSNETVYTFQVIPPFQKTVWFRLSIVGLAVLIFLAVFAYRKQQRKRLEKIRNRIATDLHDDMGSTLSSIRIFSDVAKKQIEEVKPETVQLLDRISNNATSLSENMQDIIWTIRSDNDTLEDLVSRMREFGLRVCDAKQIKFNTIVSQSFKASKLTLEQRRNLYLIFREALNNAVKYAESTQIDLRLNLKGRFLKMELNDNGKGFMVDAVKRGNGLNNLEKRAIEIGGQIEIKSQPGKGTNINLMVVLKKSLQKSKLA